MQILKILSDIWKSGAEIYRDESDGQLGLRNHKNVPVETMKAAENVFGEIDEWFRSWEGASAVDVTIRKALHLYCGWECNDKMNEWLCNDIDSLLLLHDWTIVLTKNGWTDLYSDFRQYANDESNKLAKEIYERAVAYAKKGA